jgi:predicted thioesterase
MMEKGLSAQSKVTVDGGNVAATMGSGDLQVFATPAMVALMENAAMKAGPTICRKVRRPSAPR